jgi:hypothetical protein
LDVVNASTGITTGLGQEKAKVLTLDKELTKVRKNLKAEASEHGMLCATIGVVCDDLRVAQAEGTSSLVAHVIDMKAQACVLERNVLCASILKSFMIARSHYGDNIDLDTMSLGYVLGYEDMELEEIETVVARLAQDLSTE